MLLQSSRLFGQASAERQALKSIQKGKWDKAYSQLQEAADKDSSSIYAAYLLAQFFIAPANPHFQPDSAYRFSLKALNDYQNAPIKQRERLLRQAVDSSALIRQQQFIDSVAFLRAKQLNTEDGYLHFLSYFKTAVEYSNQAITLRNEAAYLTAAQVNSYESYYDFLAKYPDSEQREEAKSKYEELLFVAKTSDKRLASYEQYLINYPNTAYQQEAERHVFEISTASGTIEAYKVFIESYGGSSFRRRARDILFHLLPRDQADQSLPDILNSDSLQNVIASGRGYIVPFLHNGEFGFMNQQGVQVISVGKEEINQEYRCGNVAEDVIVLPSGIVSPNGALIWDHPVQSIEDIGYGFITIQEAGCISVLHKSGFKIGSDCITEAKVLNGRFLALLKDTRWSIWSFNGRMLMTYDWDDITGFRDVLCLKAGDKIVLSTVKAIALIADQQPLVLPDSVDEVKPWRNEAIWFRKGALQGVVDQSLDTVINASGQVLTQAYFGTIAVSPAGTKIIDDTGDESTLFDWLVTQEPWTAVKTNGAWHLFDPTAKTLMSPAYDSVSFTGPFAIASGADSVKVYFSLQNLLRVKKPARIAFVPGQNSSSYLLLEQDEKKTIYSLEGKKMFTVTYDDVQYAGEGFFRVVKRDKKGMITSAGKVLLPLSYDAIGTVKDGVVSLLTSMKFGAFDCARRKLIKPQYEKNIGVYNKTVLTAYKNGLYGFIGWKNEPISKIEFDEIRFWNDSAALVRKNSEWMIYEIGSKKILLDKIQEYKFIRDDQEGKLAILQQDHKFGVIHSEKGTIIPITFSDIINVGSTAEPLYFTEKHVEEASIFVVIYYDSSGKILRREIYEQDEYEKIYCSNN